MNQETYDILIAKVRQNIERIVSSKDKKYIVHVLKIEREAKLQYAMWSEGLEKEFYRVAHGMYESALDMAEMA